MERYIEVTKMSTKVEKDITIEKMECKLLGRCMTVLCNVSSCV